MEEKSFLLFLVVALHNGLLALYNGVNGLCEVMTGAGSDHHYQTIDQIVCGNVPWFLPFARIIDGWFWKKTREKMPQDIPETGKGANANMAGMGIIVVMIAIAKINHVAWTDSVAIVFLCLLIKTVLSSKYLLLIPFKLWQLFYGKPQKHQTKHKDKTVSMTDPDNNWCRVAANFSDKRRYLLEP